MTIAPILSGPYYPKSSSQSVTTVAFGGKLKEGLEAKCLSEAAELSQDSERLETEARDLLEKRRKQDEEDYLALKNTVLFTLDNIPYTCFDLLREFHEQEQRLAKKMQKLKYALTLTFTKAEDGVKIDDIVPSELKDESIRAAIQEGYELLFEKGYLKEKRASTFPWNYYRHGRPGGFIHLEYSRGNFLTDKGKAAIARS